MSKKAKYVKTGEAAKRLGVTQHTIVNWCKQGKLRCVKPGGVWLVHTDVFKEGA